MWHTKALILQSSKPVQGCMARRPLKGHELAPKAPLPSEIILPQEYKFTDEQLKFMRKEGNAMLPRECKDGVGLQFYSRVGSDYVGPKLSDASTQLKHA